MKAGSDWQYITGHCLSDSTHLKGCAELLMLVITKQATKGGFRPAMGLESVSSNTAVQGRSSPDLNYSLGALKRPLLSFILINRLFQFIFVLR